MEQMIYPGEFIPLMTEAEFVSALKKSDNSGSEVPVNVSEFSDSYKLDIAIPGVKNENLLVYTDANKLSVCVFKKIPDLPEKEISVKHEFNYDCFERNIFLPENADMSFVVAEYESGILHLYVSKSETPSMASHNRIVVY